MRYDSAFRVRRGGGGGGGGHGEFENRVLFFILPCA